MKSTVMRPVEIEVIEIEMKLAVRHGEEAIPNDFPGRQGDMLTLCVNVDTGLIKGFPNRSADIYMKVCDEGTYTLYAPDGTMVKRLENEYVPHGMVPGEYGDYVILKIKAGKIVNWPKRPSLKDFFPPEEPGRWMCAGCSVNLFEANGWACSTPNCKSKAAPASQAVPLRIKIKWGGDIADISVTNHEIYATQFPAEYLENQIVKLFRLVVPKPLLRREPTVPAPTGRAYQAAPSEITRVHDILINLVSFTQAYTRSLWGSVIQESTRQIVQCAYLPAPVSGSPAELDLDAIEAKITQSVLDKWPQDLADFADAMIEDLPALIAENRSLRGLAPPVTLGAAPNGVMEALQVLSDIEDWARKFATEGILMEPAHLLTPWLARLRAALSSLVPASTALGLKPGPFLDEAVRLGAEADAFTEPRRSVYVSAHGSGFVDTPKHCAECGQVMPVAPGIGPYCHDHGDGPAREDAVTAPPVEGG